MVKLLDETTVDQTETQVDADIAAADMAAAQALFPSNAQAPDLSDGGVVNGAKLTPMQAGQKMTHGRAAARRAWTWDGRESLLPLGWNNEGTRHDAARPYLLKRHCMCCGDSGWRGAQCRKCVESYCTQCNASTQPEKIIANFHLNQEDVPHPAKMFGDINCFLEMCQRTGDKGFKTPQDMRMHAITRHKKEYQAYQDAQRGGQSTELAELRTMVLQLQAQQQQRVMIEPEVAQRIIDAAAAGKAGPTEDTEPEAKEPKRASKS